jgi:hypothetical protein
MNTGEQLQSEWGSKGRQSREQETDYIDGEKRRRDFTFQTISLT